MANTGYRRFLAAPEADGFAIDPAKVAADVQFDGIFVLRTSLSMSALAVVLRYRSLLSAIRSLFEMPCLLPIEQYGPSTYGKTSQTAVGQALPWVSLAC